VTKVWSDEAAAAAAMKLAGLDEGVVYTKKIVTPAQAKKILDKDVYTSILSNWSSDVVTAPLLVPETDPRPALDSSKATEFEPVNTEG
jgi:hypothetical protein